MKGRVIKHRYVLFALIVTGFLGGSLITQRLVRPTQAQDETRIIPAIPVVPPGQAYRQANLVSDVPGLSFFQDPLLVNPWGITSSATSPFWVANNGTSTATLYGGDISGSPLTRNALTVNIPGGLPTGVVFNGSADFAITDGSGTSSARFIFASLTGNLDGWRAGNSAVIAASQPGHVYTGLAIGNNGAANFLYAANFAAPTLAGSVEVFNGTFTAQSVASFPFIDSGVPALPADFRPYNIQNLGGFLYVTYAKIDPITHRNQNGPGLGYVSKFTTSGVFVQRLVSNGPLNSPWGITIAPAFGVFGGALLVGNFSDSPGISKINAFNASTGAFLGTLKDESGNDIVIDGLWSLQFGNGVGGGDTSTLYFSAGLAAEEHGLFGSLKPTTATATSLVQFAGDTFAIGEGNGHIDIAVTRAGDASGTATVNVNTYDASQAGHASQKSDYEIALAKLTFNPGETSKTIRILIVDDLFVEGDETVNLALSNPAGPGVGLGSPNQATLTIKDNDSVAPTTNPIDTASFFVRQHYLDFLNREPDVAGLNFWTNNITSCGANASCIEVARINTSAAFFLSIEFQSTGTLAYLANKAAVGAQAPGASAALPVLYGQFERDLQQLQQNLVFGQAGFDAQLESNKQAYFANFVSRPDFVDKYPTTQTPAQYVDALIANTGLVFATTPPERNTAINEFGGATNTTDQAARARALRDVVQIAGFAQAEFNRIFVAMEYFGYLRRDPDTAGYNFWLNKLNSFNGDFIKAEMVKAFLGSSEYRQRFGPG